MKIPHLIKCDRKWRQAILQHSIFFHCWCRKTTTTLAVANFKTGSNTELFRLLDYFHCTSWLYYGHSDPAYLQTSAAEVDDCCSDKTRILSSSVWTGVWYLVYLVSGVFGVLVLSMRTIWTLYPTFIFDIWLEICGPHSIAFLSDPGPICTWP